MKRIKHLLKKHLPSPILSLIKKILKRGEPEMYVIPRILKSKDGNAIDIGANEGAYTRYLSEKYKNMEIHSFEPQPKMCEILREIKHSNIHIYNVGLSDAESKLTLNIPYNTDGTTRTSYATFNELKEPHESIYVPAKTLDSYNFKDVRFIKIDVEGYENSVLKGAEQTIRLNMPIMLIEIEQRHLNRSSEKMTVEQIINNIINWGYSCYYYENKKLQSVDINNFRIDKYQERYPENRRKARREGIIYINNFYFLPQNGGGNNYHLHNNTNPSVNKNLKE